MLKHLFAATLLTLSVAGATWSAMAEDTPQPTGMITDRVETNLGTSGFTSSEKNYTWTNASQYWTRPRHNSWTRYWEHRPVEYSITSKDFTGKNYTLGNFSRYDLGNGNFRNAILTEANFKYANLGGANFTGSHLMGANFRQSNLMGADFSGADMTRARFYGADLRGAKYNKQTLLPSGFIPQRHGMIYLD